MPKTDGGLGGVAPLWKMPGRKGGRPAAAAAAAARKGLDSPVAPEDAGGEGRGNPKGRGNPRGPRKNPAAAACSGAAGNRGWRGGGGWAGYPWLGRQFKQNKNSRTFFKLN